MNSEIKNYIDTLYNNLLAKIRKKQILYGGEELTGLVEDCYVFGINYNNGNLFYRDQDDMWQPVPSNGGGGGGGILHFAITESDFEVDGVTYLNNELVDDNTSIFWNDINRFIYWEDGEWEYVSGGVKILIPGFDATTSELNLEIFTKS